MCVCAFVRVYRSIRLLISLCLTVFITVCVSKYIIPDFCLPYIYFYDSGKCLLPALCGVEANAHQPMLTHMLDNFLSCVCIGLTPRLSEFISVYY